MNTSSASRHHEPSWYEIRLQGRLDPMTSASLDGMTLKPDTDGTTLIGVPVTDQAALHGLLAQLCAFDLPLVSVARVELDGRRTLPTCTPTATSRTPVPGMTTTARRIIGLARRPARHIRRLANTGSSRHVVRMLRARPPRLPRMRRRMRVRSADHARYRRLTHDCRRGCRGLCRRPRGGHRARNRSIKRTFC